MNDFKSGDIVVIRPGYAATLIEETKRQQDSTTKLFLEHLMTGEEFVVLQILPTFCIIQDVLIGKQMGISKYILMLKNSSPDMTEFLNLL